MLKSDTEDQTHEFTVALSVSEKAISHPSRLNHYELRIHLGNAVLGGARWRIVRAVTWEGRFRKRCDASFPAELRRVPRRKEAKKQLAPGPQKLGDEIIFTANRSRQQRQQHGLSPVDR